MSNNIFQNGENSPTILVVDDDASMRVLLANLLRRNGYTVFSAADYNEMQEQLDGKIIQLILLDVMLPGLNGFQICQSLRQSENSKTPIIMISARDGEADMVAGLELGADDYIAKPFGQSEVLARIRAVLRRPPLQDGIAKVKANCVTFRGWIMNLRRRVLTSPTGAEVTLSSAEFDLLANMIEFPEQIISRDRLLELSRFRIAGSSDRSVDVLISRLRNKLSDSEEPLIKTVRGFGYMFAAPVERS